MAESQAGTDCMESKRVSGLANDRAVFIKEYIGAEEGRLFRRGFQYA